MKKYFFNKQNAIQIGICTFIHVHDSLFDIYIYTYIFSIRSHIVTIKYEDQISIVIIIYNCRGDKL